MTTRTVIPHVDDLGASHGANAAFRVLREVGAVSCGSVMVPGAWFREIVEMSGDADLGVHLTLTSEWRHCRWSPISTVSPASGLIDADGYFWADTASVRRHAVPEAVEAECRAQIDRARAAGLSLSHLDSHMGASMMPEFRAIQLRLAEEYGLAPVLPRQIAWVPDGDDYRGDVEALVATGAAPAIEGLLGTMAVEPQELERRWERALDALPPGCTHLALHPTAPGDFAAAAPDHARWREAEFEYLRRGGLSAACAEREVEIVGYRTLKQ